MVKAEQMSLEEAERVAGRRRRNGESFNPSYFMQLKEVETEQDRAFALAQDFFDTDLTVNAQRFLPHGVVAATWEIAVGQLARRHLADWSQGIYNELLDVATVLQQLPTVQDWFHENLHELICIVSNIQPDPLLPQRR